MKSLPAMVVTGAALWLSSAVAYAQTVTVQLPSVRTFSVGTSVLVPDRGATYLGGVKRASYGSSSFGVPGLRGVPGAGRLFGNRAIGADVSSSSAWATATIIDHDELDRAVLAEAAARRGAPPVEPAIARKAAFITRHIARTGSVPTAAPTGVARRDASMAPR
jgi:type II secretory pathway component GspD/PulD (secretin)